MLEYLELAHMHKGEEISLEKCENLGVRPWFLGIRPIWTGSTVLRRTLEETESKGFASDWVSDYARDRVRVAALFIRLGA